MPALEEFGRTLENNKIQIESLSFRTDSALLRDEGNLKLGKYFTRRIKKRGGFWLFRKKKRYISRYAFYSPRSTNYFRQIRGEVEVR